MTKFSKLIWLTVLLMLIAACAVSCKDDEPAGGREPSAPVDENVIYSPYVKTVLVLGDGVDESDVKSICSTYYKVTGRELEIKGDPSSDSHRIIVGRVDTPLSERAERYLTRSADSEVGYVIYSDTRSVAISFDEAVFGENVAFGEAVECFVSRYMNGSVLKLDAGAVFYDAFDPIEKQKERDNERTDKRWDLKLSQIAAKIDGGTDDAAAIVTQLKNLREVFNKDYSIIKWLANLYDPECGGFYYSNSARNNKGYLPDLESTSQALGLVEAILTGYGGTVVDYFGGELAESFVTFVNNMQDPNGYFYHPQWTRELVDKNIEKRSRDVLNALSILEFFGASPIYDTPNGVKGDGGVSAVSALTLPMRRISVKAVSVILSDASDEIYIPPHMRNEDSFRDYLAGLDIGSNAKEVCETLYSELPLYKAVDELLSERGEKYRLCDLLVSHLERAQNSYTGLWSRSNTPTYDDIGVLYSVIKLYDGLGRSMPRYGILINTIYKSVKFNTEVEKITDISGTWTSFAALVNNIMSYGNDATRQDASGYLRSIYNHFDILLKAAGEKLMLFIKADGSFSGTPESSVSELLGMPMAVPGMDEGDMNATLLAVKNTWLAVFGVLDIGSVPIFNTADRMMLQKTLLDMGVIIKNEIKKTPAIDFEADQIGSDAGVRHTSGSSYSKAEVVEGPSDKGHVLRLYSAEESGLDQFFFDVTAQLKSAGCYAYELDMCVLPDTSEGSFVNMYIFQDTYMIALNREGDKIRFLEESSRSSAYSYTQDLGIRADVGEWFNLRVEYYPGTAKTVRIKIYFNGECVAVTDNFFNSDKYEGLGEPSAIYNSFAIYGMGKKTTDVLVDNIVTEKTYKTYTPETSSSLNRNVDTPDKPQKIHDFEGATAGTVPADFTVSGDKTAVAVKTDSDGNKLLSFGAKGGELILPLDQRGTGINSALIEFDINVSSESAAGAKYQISFNEYLYNERCFGAMQLIVAEEGGNKYLRIAEAISGKTGTVYSNVKMSLGVNYRLSLRIFFEECAMVVSVDDEIVGVNANILNGAKRYYMGECTIESLTPDVSSTILLDNLVSERVRSSFDDTTAPDIPRESYTFDSADGMELSGVSPEGGVLSFGDVYSGKAYVKIPVNVRVNAPNMALFGFDVTRIADMYGSLTLTLSDRKGNITAAFDLVSTHDGTRIYERTLNGRYPASIYTAEGDSFSISFEYSKENESFNILIDGEYTAASSLQYSSSSYEFEYFTIGTTGSAGFIIDNLYAEEINGIFKAHTVVLPNLDNTESVITYETSSFASMPSRLEMHSSTAATYFRIREGNIRGAVTKVLEFNSGIGTNNDHAIFSRTETASGMNSVFFETDIMLKSTGDVLSLTMEFRNKTTLGYNFRMEVSAPGDNVKIFGAGGRDFSASLGVKDGEWFRLRLEYRDIPHDFDYDGMADVLFRAYVNGTLVGEGHTPMYPDDIPAGATVNQMRLTVSPRIAGKMYFDNTSLGQCNMTYEPPMEPDTHTITYEPGIITDKTKPTLGSGSAVKISEMRDASGQIGKVLQINSAKDALDTLSVSPTLTLDRANAVTFETDIRIDPASDSALLYLEPLTAGGARPFRLILKAVKGGDVTISSSDIAEKVIGRCGEWMHIKVEYMNPRVDYNGDRVDDILYKVYIGGSDEPSAIGYKPYKSGAYHAPLSLTKYNLTVVSGASADIFLDNTRFWQTELTPDKAPEFSGDYTGGAMGETDDNIVDNSGWTN